MSQSIRSRLWRLRRISPTHCATRRQATDTGNLPPTLKARINQRLWIEKDGTYGDFYGSRVAGGQCRQKGRSHR